MKAAHNIPAAEFRNAPRITKYNGIGMGIRVVDPAWIARREREIEAEAFVAESMPPEIEAEVKKVLARSPPRTKKRQENPDRVIREMAKAFGLPEHILRTRDLDYINDALFHTAKALSERCQQLDQSDIAMLLGYGHRGTVSKLLNRDKPSSTETEEAA